MWYFIACSNRFNDMKPKFIKALAKEISNISAHIPLHEPIKGFKKGEIKSVVDNLKLKIITVSRENKFRIKGFQEDFTPLKLLALFYYCVDRMTKGQLEGKQNLEWLTFAKVLIKNDKPTRKKRKS